MKFFLGVDAGGSHCRAQLETAAGQVIGCGLAGPANVANLGQQALANIERAIEAALADAGDEYSKKDSNHTQAVLGLAGYNVARGRATLAGWQAPFAHTHITGDMHIAAVGAHSGQDGAIIIVGTGSAAFLQCNGEQHTLGGYGFTLGDQASGARLGAQTVELLLRMVDGLIPACEFLSAALAATDCTCAQQLYEKYHSAAPAQFAQLAPLVFDYAQQNNPTACALVQQAADYIAQLIDQLSARAQSGVIPIAISGGLSQALAPYLSASHRAQLTSPQYSPLQGALLLARSIGASTAYTEG